MERLLERDVQMDRTRGLTGLPLGMTFGFGYVDGLEGVYGFWLGLATGVGVAALLLGYRLWRVSGDSQLIKKLSLDAEKQTTPDQATTT